MQTIKIYGVSASFKSHGHFNVEVMCDNPGEEGNQIINIESVTTDTQSIDTMKSENRTEEEINEAQINLASSCLRDNGYDITEFNLIIA